MEGRQLVLVYDGALNDQPAKVVDARELHEALESKRNFSTWINYRVNQPGFQEGIDYIVWCPNLGCNMAGGWNRKEYRLSLDMAKHLCMMERTEAGHKVRSYFIEIERRDAARSKELPSARKALDGGPRTLYT